MKLNRLAKFNIAFVLIATSLMFSGVKSSYAAQLTDASTSDNSAAGLIKSATPTLNCLGSGESTGSHPGWSSPDAIQFTQVQLSASLTGLYWCPAAAPFGKGVISYTVTESTQGASCETEFTFCGMSAVTPSSSFSIMATDRTGSYPVTDVATQNSGAVAPCDPNSSSCHVAAAQVQGSLLGDLTSSLPNCTFVAVANWENFALGVKTDSKALNTEFMKAGGGQSGLTNDQVFDYWNRLGIGGVHLNSVEPIGVDPFTLKSEVNSDDFNGFIAQLRFTSGQSFAGYVVTAPSYHWVVVVGYTQMGPVVVSWGQTLQMTWQQWNIGAVTMWDFLTA